MESTEYLSHVSAYLAGNKKKVKSASGFEFTIRKLSVFEMMELADIEKAMVEDTTTPIAEKSRNHAKRLYQWCVVSPAVPAEKLIDDDLWSLFEQIVAYIQIGCGGGGETTKSFPEKQL